MNLVFVVVLLISYCSVVFVVVFCCFLSLSLLYHRSMHLTNSLTQRESAVVVVALLLSYWCVCFVSSASFTFTAACTCCSLLRCVCLLGLVAVVVGLCCWLCVVALFVGSVRSFACFVFFLCQTLGLCRFALWCCSSLLAGVTSSHTQ